MNKYIRKLFGAMFQSQQTQFPWRTEAEIDVKRQEELSKCRAIVPDIEKGIYPFKGMKLSRADVEWLLATHENGRGPVDWNDESQRERHGLDLRGANLRRENLSDLPLTRMRGGLTSNERVAYEATEEQQGAAAVHLEGANLQGAQLQRANLLRAQLQGAILLRAQLQQANLKEAQLQGAHPQEAQLQGAFLEDAQLQGANLISAQLQGAFLGGAQLQQADLNRANLEGANLISAQLQGADFFVAQLQGANLLGAQLQGANLEGARLQGARLQDAELQGAFIRFAQLQQANLTSARLQGADLRRTDLKHATLDQVTFSDQTYGSARFADINWGEVNLAVIGWGHVTRLGDEQVAHQEKRSRARENFHYPSNWINWSEREVKSRIVRLNEYKEAVRANRQLTVVLRDQGLNEEADHFAYRAQVLQRKVFWIQRDIGKWLFSLLLAFVAGYGYRIWRILAAYLIIVFVCAVAYFVLSIFYAPQMSPLEAVLTSITAFHGRVF